jgi:hypothetical protein
VDWLLKHFELEPFTDHDHDFAVYDASSGQVHFHRFDDLGEVAGHRFPIPGADLQLVAVAENDGSKAVHTWVRSSVHHRGSAALIWPASGQRVASQVSASHSLSPTTQTFDGVGRRITRGARSSLTYDQQSALPSLRSRLTP